MMNNTNNIQKPVSMVIEESKNIIVNAINSVQLHPTLLEMIVKELYLEIQGQVTATAQREKAEYENALAESMRVKEVPIEKVDDLEVVSDVD